MDKIKRFDAFFESNVGDDVIALLQKSFDNGWFGNNMDNSFSCARCDNGWVDKLAEQYKDDTNVIAILSKIDKCTTTLWNDELSDTFDCVLMEDTYDENEVLSDEYNGWYEDLIAHLTMV